MSSTKEDKYYVPNISEFHVGFEYEFVTYNNIWLPSKYSGASEEALQGVLDSKYYRVKYLDKEDIESLGWSYIGSSREDGGIGTLYELKSDRNQTKIMWVRPDIDHESSSITIYRKLTVGVLVSDIIIKNKSELKRLMKQLAIYE